MPELIPTRIDLQRLVGEVEALEASWKKVQPEPGAILFYGSSTMVCWREDGLLEQQMAPLRALNTGFGGSTADEALYYYPRLVYPLRPSVLVYYEGDNDLALGYKPYEVISLSHRLFEWARADLPGIQFVIIPVKESPSRREVLGEIRALNQLWRDYAAQFGDIRLVETPALTLDEHSNARGAYYREDDLHLNPLGYVQLECYVKPVLLELTGGRP